MEKKEGAGCDTSEKKRTKDVVVDDDILFSDMLLSEATLKGLNGAGFNKPSPIQKKAIPLGRCGFDLIIQAKSGTGKTCVFTVIAMEMLMGDLQKVQVLVLAPTREISVQIAEVMTSIFKHTSKLKVKAFIGGVSVMQDKKCAGKCPIVVGTPGRIKHLVTEGSLPLDSVRLFVLDEADFLMEGKFQDDISYIYSMLPERKQMIAASATYPEEVEKFIAKFMVNPLKVSPGEGTMLIGIRQFVSMIPPHPTVLVQMKSKMAALSRILRRVSFKQCLIFSNYQSRAESFCDSLKAEGWEAVYINGALSQAARQKAFNCLKEYRCRILLSTDLTSRGIDVENVNLVVNMDLPYDGATYLHRIGRAGRFGTHGIAVTIIQEGEELERFQNLLYEVGGVNFRVSVFPKEETGVDIWESSEDDFEKLHSTMGEYKFKKMKDSEEKEQVANVNLTVEGSSSSREKLPGDVSLAKAVENLKVSDGEIYTVCDNSQDAVKKDRHKTRNGTQDHVYTLISVDNKGRKCSGEEFKIEPSKAQDHDSHVETDVKTGPTSLHEIGNKFESEPFGSGSSSTSSCSSSSCDSSNDDEEGDSDEEEDNESESCVDSETCTDSETDILVEDNNQAVYNYKLQNWYSSWLHQVAQMRLYVQYYNYMKEMVNFG